VKEPRSLGITSSLKNETLAKGKQTYPVGSAGKGCEEALERERIQNIYGREEEMSVMRGGDDGAGVGVRAPEDGEVKKTDQLLLLCQGVHACATKIHPSGAGKERRSSRDRPRKNLKITANTKKRPSSSNSKKPRRNNPVLTTTGNKDASYDWTGQNRKEKHAFLGGGHRALTGAKKERGPWEGTGTSEVVKKSVAGDRNEKGPGEGRGRTTDEAVDEVEGEKKYWRQNKRPVGQAWAEL